MSAVAMAGSINTIIIASYSYGFCKNNAMVISCNINNICHNNTILLHIHYFATRDYIINNYYCLHIISIVARIYINMLDTV